MATLLLSILIFGLAAWIIYKQLKGNGHCEDCASDCLTKTRVTKKTKLD